MKILYVIPYFAPAWSFGGPVKASFDFARKLTHSGHKVTVATTDVLGAESRNKKLHQEIGGVEVFRFRNISHNLARNFNFYTPIGLNKWLKQNIRDYDIIHIHEFFTYQSILAGRICQKYHKPYAIQPHGSFSRVARESRFYFIKKFFIRKFKFLALSSRAVIVLNKKEEKDALDVYPQIKSKIKIIPNGIDLDEFKGVKTIDLHKRYNIPLKNKIIVFIGRIKFVKGLDISLRALAGLKDELNFTFLIIGPDEGEKDNLIKLAEELGVSSHLIFAGLISGAKKLETLKSADLSLLNSRSEGLPTTLLESAALGLPIICSSESNFPEVRRYKAGFVVRNEEQTGKKIKLILKDARLRRQLARNALNLANSFNLRGFVEALKVVYESIL